MAGKRPGEAGGEAPPATASPLLKLSRLGVLLALGLALQALESGLPPLGPLPGGRLGLGNLPVLLAVLRLGAGESLLLAVLRPALGGLLLGTAFTPAQLLSQGGSLLAWGFLAFGRRFYPARLSPVGLSLLGALGHNLGQLLLASWYLRFDILRLAPVVLPLSLPGGLLLGFLALRLEPILQKKENTGRDLVPPDRI